VRSAGVVPSTIAAIMRGETKARGASRRMCLHFEPHAGREHASRSLCPSIARTITLALKSNPHSARCPTAASLPATWCLGAFSPACEERLVMPASKDSAHRRSLPLDVDLQVLGVSAVFR
jgi:hypothetical protein